MRNRNAQKVYFYTNNTETNAILWFLLETNHDSKENVTFFLVSIADGCYIFLCFNKKKKKKS